MINQTNEIMFHGLPWGKIHAKRIAELRLYIEHQLLIAELRQDQIPYDRHRDDPLWQAICNYFAMVIQACNEESYDDRLAKIATIVGSGMFIEDLGSPETVLPRGFDKTLETQQVIDNATFCRNYIDDDQLPATGEQLKPKAFEAYMASTRPAVLYKLIRQPYNDICDAVSLYDGQFLPGLILAGQDESTQDVVARPEVEHGVCSALLRDIGRGIQPRDILLPDQNQINALNLLARLLSNLPFTYQRSYLILSGIFNGLLPAHFADLAVIGLEEAAISDKARLESFIHQFSAEEQRRMPPIFTAIIL
jgi:hypothetical protein